MSLSFRGLQETIASARAAIRYHRDQKGDNRCWVDDYLVWKFLPDSAPEPTVPPPFEQAMGCCKSFYTKRRCDVQDQASSEAVLDSALWDKDLAEMNEEESQKEWEKIAEALRRHRDIAGRERTLDDDRLLYEVLPERLPADFRLPNKAEFIDGVKPGCGCPNFWKSHESCPTKKHNLHTWGPCE